MTTARNYYVEPVKYWDLEVVPKVRDRNKVTIPKLKIDKRVDIANSKLVEKGDLAPIDRVDRFNNLSATTLNQIVENGQIAASTAMQIRSVQTLAAPASVLMEKKSSSFPVAKVGANYFDSSRFRFATVK